MVDLSRLNVQDLNKSKQDVTCLAENACFLTDSKLSGINLNEMIVGPTGGGKTYSVVIPRLLHTFNSSLVVTLTKREVYDAFAKYYKSKGYKVITLDFINPENSPYGYDPLEYVKTPEEVAYFAEGLVGKDTLSNDMYWIKAAASLIQAEIMLVMQNAKYAGKKASMADVIKLHKTLRFEDCRGISTANLDILFEKLKELYPDHQAVDLWNTVSGISSKTTSCIYSVANAALDKIFTPGIVTMAKAPSRVDFAQLGEEKTILFILTSPINTALMPYINIMYSDLFRILLDSAEKRKDHRLPVPVHVICDDFASGSCIYDFDKIISIFRAAGMSVTLLLQSESQLEKMYKGPAAVTIINNCDTYVYMGGNDVDTATKISARLNRSLSTVLNLPLGKVVVFRRGSKPIINQRYQIFEDPKYKDLFDSKGE